MRQKIFLDLKQSNYKVKIGSLEFYFSSEFYKKKFEKEADNFAVAENMKFEIRYKVKVNLYTVFLISYYKKLEKRGFRIIETRSKKEIEENLAII